MLDAVNGWVKFAEAKNLALLTISGAGIWASLRLIADPNTAAPVAWYLAQLSFFSAVALASSLISFLPITSYSILVPTGTVSKSDNLTFYGHLAHYRKRQLVEAFASAVGASQKEITDFHEMLAEQIIVNARIALGKFRLFTLGSHAFLLGFLTPLLGLIVIWIATKKRKAVDGY